MTMTMLIQIKIIVRNEYSREETISCEATDVLGFDSHVRGVRTYDANSGQKTLIFHWSNYRRGMRNF